MVRSLVRSSREFVFESEFHEPWHSISRFHCIFISLLSIRNLQLQQCSGHHLIPTRADSWELQHDGHAVATFPSPGEILSWQIRPIVDKDKNSGSSSGSYISLGRFISSTSHEQKVIRWILVPIQDSSRRTSAQSRWRGLLRNVDNQVKIEPVVCELGWDAESFVANKRRILELISLVHHHRETFRHAVLFLEILAIWVDSLKPPAIVPLG